MLLAFYGAWRVYELHEKYMRLTIQHLQTAETKPQAALKNENSLPSVQNTIPEEEATKDFVDKATKLILEHLSQSDFTIDDLCREMAMSRTNLFAKIKAITGQTPNEFIMTLRLKRGAYMLKNNPELSISEIADRTGFASSNYFSKCFNDLYHVRPLNYRKGKVE